MVTDNPINRDRRWMATAGVAAAILLALLIFAVVRTARDAGRPAPSVSIPSPATSSATVHPGLSTPASTSYAVPTVATGTGTPEPSSGVPSPVSPVPADSAPDSSTPVPTTIFNPYATTTPPNADAI